jgi:uncharacterized repeat protein (TIGR01451 family)
MNAPLKIFVTPFPSSQPSSPPSPIPPSPPSLFRRPLLLSSRILLSLLVLLPSLPVRAQVAPIFEGFANCPAGTREGPINFVRNGNFTTNAGTGAGIPTAPAPVPAVLDFGSSLPYRGDAVYPDDPVGGLSIQVGAVNYLANPTPPPPFIVVGQPFPGDPAFGVPASSTYLYSNPNASVLTPGISGSAFPNPIVWQQVITGLVPNTSYNFTAYFYNLLAGTPGGPPSVPGAPPVIRFLAGPPGGTPGLFVPTAIASTVSAVQVWTRVQGLFRTAAGQTVLELRIEDQANTVIGDDFGMTAVGFRECIPFIGVAKSAGNPVSNADGSFTIPYTILVRNFGPATDANQYAVNNLQIPEDLVAIFSGATINAVTDLQSSTLTVNPGFNGSSDQNLLAPGNTLAGGATATLSFNVRITLASGVTSETFFDNSVVATALSQGGTPVSDVSNAGTNPDPNGNLDPTEPTENVPTRVSVIPGTPGTGGIGGLRLIKRVTNALRDGVTIAGVPFSSIVADINTNDFQEAGLSPIGVIQIDDPSLLLSGDEVEYTVYFLSSGTAPARAVSLCDLIPQGTTLVPDTTRVSFANGNPAIGGTVFSSLSPLPAGNSCTDQRNPNGAVIFDLGDIPNTPGNNFGFIRFRVRIN